MSADRDLCRCSPSAKAEGIPLLVGFVTRLRQTRLGWLTLVAALSVWQTTPLRAQDSPAPRAGSATLYGTVRAEGSREPIGFATIEIVDLRRAALADRAGYFVLPGLPTGRWTVRASAPGYAPVERTVEALTDGSVSLDFALAARPLALEGVEVRGTRAGNVSAAAGPGATRVDATVVQAVPGLAEADVLRTIQVLPSVQAASDFSSAPYVRGGFPDQNLVLLDGVPLFNPYHLGGVFGAINPDAVTSVDVLPGAFPARVGDRLSSAVEIRTRDGGRDRIRSQGAVGLISSRAGMDGPLPGGQGSYLVSARRTYVDLFTDAAQALNLISGTFPYAFTDAHLKLTHDVGKLGRLSGSLYLDEEAFRVPSEWDYSGNADFAWGSRAASVHYRQPFGPALVGEFRLAASGFAGRFDAQERVYASNAARADSFRTTVRARTAMHDLLAGADFTRYGARHELRGGVQVDAYVLDHDVVVGHPADFGGYVPNLRRRDEPRTLAAYLEDEWTATTRLRLRGGMRVLHAGGRGTAWLPRFGAHYKVTPALTLSLGGGRYAQVLHTLRDEESIGSSLVAYDLLGGITTAQGLSLARDLVLGGMWQNSSTRIRMDVYAKRFDRLPLPPVPDNALEAPVLAADSFRAGEGTAHGLELLAHHSRGRAEFTLSYALSSAALSVGGERYPPRFERRHTADALAALPLGEEGQFSMRLAAATGQPYTPVVGLLRGYRHDPAQDAWVPWGFRDETLVLGEHNSARLPAYLRLDVGARKRYRKRWFGQPVTVTPYFQVLNILNNPNVLAALPQASGFGEPQLEFAPQLPVFPTFGVEWTF